MYFITTFIIFYFILLHMKSQFKRDNSTCNVAKFTRLMYCPYRVMFALVDLLSRETPSFCQRFGHKKVETKSGGLQTVVSNGRKSIRWEDQEMKTSSKCLDEPQSE